MAEIRCPMCGKPNPAELDVCQYCEARLKPVTDELGRSQPPIHPGEEPQDMDTGQLETTLPRWLREMRQQARESMSEEQEQPRAEEEAKRQDEKADLLSGLQSQSKNDEEIPDWLSGLRNEAGKGSIEENSTDNDDLAALRNMLGEGSPASQGSESSDLPAWAPDLHGEEPGNAQDELGSSDSSSDIGRPADFEADSPLQDTSTGDEKVFDTELPAWLQDTNKPPIEESASDLPAWMRDEVSTPVEDETVSTTDEGELPAWLQDTDQASKEESDVGLPAWLDSSSEDKEVEAASQQEPDQPEVKSTTDWLASLDQEENVSQPSEEAASAVKSTTDWLASLDQETKETASEPKAAPPEEEMPDWLSSLGTESPDETSQPPTEETAVTGDLPDWLSALGEESGEAAPQVEAESFAESETPDWLSSFQGEGVSEEEQEFTTGDEIVEPAQPASEGQIPDWLAAMGEGAAESEQPAHEGPEFASETPTSESSAAPAFVDDEGKPISPEDVEAIFSMDMPDWLSDTGETAEAEAKPEVPEAGEEGLRPADLPDWVQAMRPVESVISETQGAPSEAQPIEERGPLAGLRGVLPAVPGVGPSSKPKAYSIKLQASEDQQSNAAMLEKMLAEEVYPKPVPTQKVVLSQRVLRLAISSLLLGIVALVFFSGTQMNPIVPPENNVVQDYVENTLPVNAPVLVVFDYQASLSGELEAAAAPLFDRMLTDKSPRLSLISSTPVGSGLAERFMKILQTNREYSRNVNFVNLGYLSGGAAGVQAFSKEPKTTKQLTTSGVNAWATPVLQDVNDLSGFNSIFLLTDDLETARIWIEQTATARKKTPLFVVSSAQSGPMIMPYVQSGQIAGIITGINDGAPIEQANGGRPGMARRYWDAYGFGLLTAIAMIVIGSLWSLVTGWQARRKEQGAA